MCKIEVLLRTLRHAPTRQTTTGERKPQETKDIYETTMTTMQEQIQLSGLEITSSSSSLSSSSSSSSSLFKWNSTNEWSPLLGGGRSMQACVIVENDGGRMDDASPMCEDDDDDEDVVAEVAEEAVAEVPAPPPIVQIIVVLGGILKKVGCTNSVILWDPSKKQWRKGPNLNDKRGQLVAVVCHDKVYAIGGSGSGGNKTLDTIETIHVSSLLDTSCTTTTRQNNNNARQWTRLSCRLSSPRFGCAAVVVQDRYIVIMGGHNGKSHISCVDILDIAPPPYNKKNNKNNNNKNNNKNREPIIVAGPNMNSTRYAFGAGVINNRIFVVGGMVNGNDSTSVESLLFHHKQQPQRQEDKEDNNTSSTSSINGSCGSMVFPNSSWKVEQHLTLSTTRSLHAVTRLGSSSCLIVAGGGGGGGGSLTNRLVVQVLDIQRNIVWNLPNLKVERPFGCSIITLSNCILVLGGSGVDFVDSLPLSAIVNNQLQQQQEQQQHDDHECHLDDDEEEEKLQQQQQQQQQTSDITTTQDPFPQPTTTTTTTTTNNNNNNYHHHHHDDDDDDDEKLTIPMRLLELESVLGNCVPIIQRIESLETNYGLLNGNAMNMTDRVAQLERLLEKPDNTNNNQNNNNQNNTNNNNKKKKNEIPIPMRLQKVESTLGICIPIVQRIECLEANYGLVGNDENNNGMNILDRIDQLNQLKQQQQLQKKRKFL